MSEPWPIVSVAEMRALEAAAFAAGVSEDHLQANAAEQVARVAARMAKSGPIVVLVGPGNNGRDAFLAGRLLARSGRPAVYCLTPRHAVRPDELGELSASESLYLGAGHGALARLREDLRRAQLAIDGLLGIGVRGAMRPPLDGLARTLNLVAGDHDIIVLSVDVPSGIDADTGVVVGEAVRAHCTVALGAVKAGCLCFPAANLTGRLEPRPIGLPPGAGADCFVRLLTAEQVAALVPERPLDAHKGTLGWVMVVGGSGEYVGAPILSASAAARSGCGLVALAVPPNGQAAAGAALPEATYVPRPPAQAPSQQADAIISRLDSFEALVLGPGLGREDASAELTRRLLRALRDRGERPSIVVDADALFMLAGWQDWWSQVPTGCILTPHHGEMSRLTGLAVGEIAQRPWEIAREHAARWNQIVVLKGPFTVVAAPSGVAWVHPRANPALATAGSGDVLAGLIAGLAAQGLEPVNAARLAVVVHGQAASEALLEHTWRSLIASDLLPKLPKVLARMPV